MKMSLPPDFFLVNIVFLGYFALPALFFLTIFFVSLPGYRRNSFGSFLLFNYFTSPASYFLFFLFPRLTTPTKSFASLICFSIGLYSFM